ncbi:MAG: ABC transporter substrate-binding protein [Gammaproteobacteria bacterium]|nr:ABC transporter substrate-binding protein [Gammaproteobacteria bacterium]MCY4283500.1 ABC transporter substrate-binding protein [Gammaproteobacteria bacterium]MCY4338209.1 ABC transporter substrate-binding protein [Gammaproteobacteria bacterium]
MMSFAGDRIPAFARMAHGNCRNLLLCALLVLLLPRSAGAAGMDEPAQAIAQFHGKLLQVMQQAQDLGYQGRYRELEPYINEGFDIPFIAGVILGRYRDQLSDTQRAEFNDLFSRSSTATYASRFNGYDGEAFREISRELLRRGRVLIRTELRRPHDEPVALDYLLHEKQGKWYIISVSANGVNDLSLKRAEYATVIKEKGYNGLVTEILSKIAEMENKSAPAEGK